MTVHELYEAKKKEYSQYEIQMGVHERLLSEAQSGILAAAEELKVELSKMESSELASRIDETLKVIHEWSGTLGVDVLKHIQTELESELADLEQEIRGVLE